MAGKLCYGASRNNAGAGTLRVSKAFCEGIQYRAGGTAAQRPKIDNPHVPNSDAAISWDAGWDLAESNAGSYMGATGCCAAVGNVPS